MTNRLPYQAPQKTVTLRDVAEAAGVDVSTVSRVLQDKGRASAETRARITGAAEALGYKGNPAARALKTARSQTILMVVPQIENPIFASAIIGAEIEARKAGYALVVAYDKGGGVSSIIRDVSSSNMIEGVIIASFDEDEELRQTLMSTDRPHVIMNRVLPGDSHCIAIDTRAAALIGVRHLIELGHTRIGHLAGRLGRFNGEMRREGWAQALTETGLPVDEALIVEAGYDPARVSGAVDKLLEQNVTAIHAATLLTGAAAIARLHALGYQVPKDISLVTMHDDLLARVVFPAVTTVALPTALMGEVAVKRLVGQVDGSEAETGEVLLAPGELIVRQSAGPPKS
ncbi:LacI family DNA-binding transcriptional regulator [Marivita sp. S2033]|uniref:LacI family DNA-binding transcriptional regulator n=1 Tax=Marivita sp. S2033 TaxID=3373187 RepID=UPI0039822949